MAMNARQRVNWWLTFCKTHPWYQQFGQQNDAKTQNGATGCTDTGLQVLIRGWLERSLTHDQIRAAAGNPPASRGLRPNEVQLVARKFGLRYVPKFGLTASQVLAIANSKGPVGIGVAYSHQPEKKGYSIGGHTATGKINGFARLNGKTQLYGFTGAHFDVVLGSLDGWVYVKDPNHASPARPEKPAYDIMTIAQFTKLYNSYHSVLGRALYAVVPTTQFNR